MTSQKTTRQWAAKLAHELFLLRLRIESWIARVVSPRTPRIAATACWTFPIYSQTFVHQEVAALARAGFAVRFLYTELGPREELAPACADLWSRKRRVLLTRETAAADYAKYRRRMPAKVDALIERLAQASGMRRDEIEQHEHFLHAFSYTRAVEAWGADYLHSYFFYERALFSFVAAQLLEKPRGVSCYADHLMQDYALKVVPLHLRSCDVVIATSRRIRAELEGLVGGHLDAALVKPNAIDTTRFDEHTRPFATGDTLRLLCVSRLNPKKGIEYFVDAAQILRGRGFTLDIRIVGAPDAHSPEAMAYAEMLRAKVAALGLDAVFHFEGRRDGGEVRRYLNQSHIFVAPFVELANGDKDGIPTAVLEAMASGIGIVATTAGSIREIIDDGVEGVLVEQRDAAALAAAVERLALDAPLSARLGASAGARARREFNVSTAELAFHERIRATIDGDRRALNTVRTT